MLYNIFSRYEKINQTCAISILFCFNECITETSDDCVIKCLNYPRRSSYQAELKHGDPFINKIGARDKYSVSLFVCFNVFYMGFGMFSVYML